jgi:hypothetical protein
MRYFLIVVMLAGGIAGMVSLLNAGSTQSVEVPVSNDTQDCLSCHEDLHPGIVAAWRESRHARITPAEAMQVKGLGLKVSSTEIPQGFLNVAVGCAECHTQRPEAHAGTFDHGGYDVHTAVSPKDCATCHTKEADQFSRNLMAHARGNLVNNPLYMDLARTIEGGVARVDQKLEFTPADPMTQAESCLHCHGTELEVVGSEERDTFHGGMEFPVVSGWPNQGVGRVNTDGSMGTCGACHNRHQFSIEMARQPYTCKKCHVGPDVPAYKVYSASRHGNMFSTHGKEWDFKKVPWTVGEDFTAPTCAGCHVSLLADASGNEIVPRTHQMTDRLPWRIFGLIYAHPHPISPDTSIIRNADGLPLPTNLDGTLARDFLIDAATMAERTENMQKVCRSCHGSAWVHNFWERFENTITTTNAATLEATRIMTDIWDKGYAVNHLAGGSPFDEAMERRWSDIWLFYANTIRFASSMAGGGDYGVFADGRYHIAQAIMELNDWFARQNAMEALGSMGQPSLKPSLQKTK